jgi:hypothetical protein
MNPKLLIIGHGRHGKDTVAEIIQDEYGLSFMSSSCAAAEEIRPILKSQFGLNYTTLEQCYNDRHNHRQAWKNAISEYNAEDKTRLARHILQRADIYVGLRCDVEFYAARHLFDYVIGVTAFDRVKALDPTFTISLSECDFILTNDGDEDDLENDTIVLMESRIFI